MFGFSLSEFLIIIILIIILFSPKDIVIFIQKIISFYENTKNEIDNIKSEIILIEEDEFLDEQIIDEFENNDLHSTKNK